MTRSGQRLPTLDEVRTLLSGNPWERCDGKDVWIPCTNGDGERDWAQIGNACHKPGKSHVSECGGYPCWGDNNAALQWNQFVFCAKKDSPRGEATSVDGGARASETTSAGGGSKDKVRGLRWKPGSRLMKFKAGGQFFDGPQKANGTDGVDQGRGANESNQGTTAVEQDGETKGEDVGSEDSRGSGSGVESLFPLIGGLLEHDPPITYRSLLATCTTLSVFPLGCPW